MCCSKCWALSIISWHLVNPIYDKASFVSPPSLQASSSFSSFSVTSSICWTSAWISFPSDVVRLFISEMVFCSRRSTMACKSSHSDWIWMRQTPSDLSFTFKLFFRDWRSCARSFCISDTLPGRSLNSGVPWNPFATSWMWTIWSHRLKSS